MNVLRIRQNTQLILKTPVLVMDNTFQTGNMNISLSPALSAKKPTILRFETVFVEKI